MKNLDLHIHSTASDGSLSYKQIIDTACTLNISVISITDHDNVDSLGDAEEYSSGKPVKFIPGVEISVDVDRGDFHLLGYGIDYRNERLVNMLSDLKNERKNRVKKIITAMNNAGIDISFSDIKNNDDSSALGKPHIAEALIAKGYAYSKDEAFNVFFKKGAVGDIPKKKVTPEEALDLVIKAGGIPVLAHPASLLLNADDFNPFIQKMIVLGLRGIEVYSNMHSNSDVDFYYKTAIVNQLFITGGSDFHTPEHDRFCYYGNDRLIPAEKINLPLM